MKMTTTKRMKLYLIHPYETYGSIEENRRDEERIAQDLMEKLPSFVELVRPFKEIPPDTSREEALDIGLKLLRECNGVILSGEWQQSKGCMDEYIEAKCWAKSIYRYMEGWDFPLMSKIHVKVNVIPAKEG